MKGSQSIALLALAGIAFTAWYFIRLSGESPIASLPADQGSSVASAASVPTTSPSTSADGADPQTIPDFALPDASTYRAQALAGGKPEGRGVPPVLREFSAKVADLMEKAAASQPDALALFPRLESCARGSEETLIQARTICAVNAMRLGELHPRELRAKAAALRSSLSPELSRFVQAMGY